MKKLTVVVLALGFVAMAPAPQEEPVYPLDFDKWDDVAKKAWEKGVDAATQELKDEAAKRLEAAAKALRQTAAGGVEVQEAKKVVIEAMDAGYTADEYKNLGQWIKAKHAEGLKGKALADAIHGEQAKRKAAKAGGGGGGKPGEAKPDTGGKSGKGKGK
jgi:hypothetical protein